MHVLIGIALKSLLIAGLSLGLLELMKRRSAAERSWVAHIGLLALVIVAFAPLVLPSWNVEAPALLGQASEATVQGPTSAADASPLPATAVPKANAEPRASLNPVAAATAAYALPAAILLLITFLALSRLIALRARAEVLVDSHWLSALARAQRRMGFKHGTALLTSNELPSPISWGLMRPVILLNTRAVEASGEAEAIIAHELAHVARMDWAKLLLARVATALFWFNPLVWLLAREAHQLREEAADDSVLAADIADTDYAQLLVGVARHECPGLLLGAHGVAPSKSSLARRVARVLDGASVRGPVARSFALGVFAGAVLIAAPLAALTLTPATTGKQDKSPARSLAKSGTGAPYYASEAGPTDLPHIIASGVSTSVATAAAAVRYDDEDVDSDPAEIARERAEAVREAAIERAELAVERARESATEARERVRSTRGLDSAIALKAVGATPEYVGSMRRAAPQLARLAADEFVAMKAVGVTPQYARDLIAGGFPDITADDLVSARAVGLTGAYVRELRSAGVRGDLEDFIPLRAMGIDRAFVERVRRAGYAVSDAGGLIKLQTLERVAPPAKPRSPAPPGGWGGSPPPDRPDDG